MRPTRLLPVALAAVMSLLPAVALAGGPPPGLNGPFLFVDQESFDKISSLANIDQAFNEICLAGYVAYVDAHNTLNRRVEILFDSLGTISKESDTKVDGEFLGAINLTVNIFSGPSSNASVHPLLYSTGVINPPCTLEGSVRKSGLVDRAILSCELGANLSSLGIPESVPNPFPLPPALPGPDITQQEMIDSIAFALAKKKRVKLDVKTGRLRINHSGEEMPEGFNSLLACLTSSDLD
jgi:hypothetical protein